MKEETPEEYIDKCSFYSDPNTEPVVLAEVAKEAIELARQQEREKVVKYLQNIRL